MKVQERPFGRVCTSACACVRVCASGMVVSRRVYVSKSLSLEEEKSVCVCVSVGESDLGVKCL